MTKQKLPSGYTDAKTFNDLLTKKPEEWWLQKGQEMALKLFHEMSQRVPAYQDFLSKNEISPASIKSIDDFYKIPPIDKDNYLRKYPKEMLCWDGKFGSEGSWVISTTSGSTGEPFYFPRQDLQDRQYAVMAEQYLRSNFDIQNKSTLYIVAFPMGAWIGGVFTYEALKLVASKDEYRLSIITPGINKQEVINSVKQLGKSFDQVIIGAYAPFLKDILDDGMHQGITWSDYDIGFVFSAEAFSENFRDYVLDLVNTKNRLTATLNHYGTVDMGTMAHETPESILIRRSLIEADNLSLIFPEKKRQATFCQYNPELYYFEEDENNLLCSSYSGLPLVRYNLKDYGGIIGREETHAKLLEKGIDLNDLIKQNDLEEKTWNLPFVYIYERNDFSVSYYAFLIYPEMIRNALQKPELASFITSKFTMFVDYSKGGRQQFHVNIEKHKDVSDDKKLEKLVLDNIHETLLIESSEYREVFQMMGLIVKPHIRLWEYEDPIYFRPGGKQKWVIK